MQIKTNFCNLCHSASTAQEIVHVKTGVIFLEIDKLSRFETDEPEFCNSGTLQPTKGMNRAEGGL